MGVVESRRPGGGGAGVVTATEEKRGEWCSRSRSARQEKTTALPVRRISGGREPVGLGAVQTARTAPSTSMRPGHSVVRVSVEVEVEDFLRHVIGTVHVYP